MATSEDAPVQLEPSVSDSVIQDESKSQGEAVPVAEKPKPQEDDDYDHAGEYDSQGYLDVLGSGRLRKKTLKEGDISAGKPRQGDTVRMKYTVSFDGAIRVKETEIEFQASESEVIQAMDLVCCLMHPGEITEVIADPEFAYGQIGLPGSGIPPKAAVIFQMELLSMEMSASIQGLELNERLRIGRRKKDCGNYWFARQEVPFAMQCYRKAIEYFDDEALTLDVPIDRFSLPEEFQVLLGERLKALNNLALCQIKIDALDSALMSLSYVLKVEPNNEKALYRKGKALQSKNRIDEALGIYKRIQMLYPNNTQVKADILKLSSVQKKNKEKETRLSRKMLGLDKVEAEKSSNVKAYLKVMAKNIGFAACSLGVVLAAVAVSQKWNSS
ncbi:hypothetical protein TCAL_02985 [Tigriopus californicus]|uniref:peptidylprolyl isomerase n=1 Tax=Tigriopus californicus TaxID=6832 RepID=A0A553PT48_TIGCA|nr:peptidyl-prolyl cis-trans isomerase FKBP8-like [Tigriopus californicus]TRY80857.1 hypothetical protein TCAL_02985 [Tigriopus californicus]